MQLKVKAVIVRPDRVNDVIVLRKKHIKDGVFKHGQTPYIIDPNRMMVTDRRVLRFWKIYYRTYYYKQGMTKPLPFPDFPDILDNGVTPGELEAIFNPWFYRTIASHGMDKLMKLMFFLNVATLLGLIWVGYQVANLEMPDLSTIPGIGNATAGAP